MKLDAQRVAQEAGPSHRPHFAPWIFPDPGSALTPPKQGHAMAKHPRHGTSRQDVHASRRAPASDGAQHTEEQQQQPQKLLPPPPQKHPPPQQHQGKRKDHPHKRRKQQDEGQHSSNPFNARLQNAITAAHGRAPTTGTTGAGGAVCVAETAEQPSSTLGQGKPARPQSWERRKAYNKQLAETTASAAAAAAAAGGERAAPAAILQMCAGAVIGTAAGEVYTAVTQTAVTAGCSAPAGVCTAASAGVVHSSAAAMELGHSPGLGIDWDAANQLLTEITRAGGPHISSPSHMDLLVLEEGQSPLTQVICTACTAL